MDIKDIKSMVASEMLADKMIGKSEPIGYYMSKYSDGVCICSKCTNVGCVRKQNGMQNGSNQ